MNKNRDKARQLWRNAYARNRETKLARVLQYRKDNPEKVKACSRKSCKRWSQTEFGKRKNVEKVLRYRARKLGAKGVHTHEQFLEMAVSFDCMCLKCGNKFSINELTEDHIIPLSRGGSNDISNIQPLCHACNSGKRDSVIDYRPAVNG